MERRKFLTDSAKYTALTFVGTSMFNNNLFASSSMITKQHSSLVHTEGIVDSIPSYQNVTTVVKLKGPTPGLRLELIYDYHRKLTYIRFITRAIKDKNDK